MATGKYDDWTGNVVPSATIRDLDIGAVRSVRAQYLSVDPAREAESVDWDDERFLAETGFTKRGKLTNAALVLLGKGTEELLPRSVCIRWRLYGVDGKLEDSRILGCPLALSVRSAVSVVRNPTVQVGSGDRRRSVSTYRIQSLTEALMNAVAFQDYEAGGTIELIEREAESVEVVNSGTFPDVAPEEFALGRPSFRDDRNACLRRCMASVGLVPGSRSGIRGMYLSQAFRRFPMPTFDTGDGTVSVTFHGRRQGAYARLLDVRDDIGIADIMDLDRFSKGRYLPDRRISELCSQGLMEIAGGVPVIVAEPESPSMFRGDAREAVMSLIDLRGSVTRSEVAEMLRSVRPVTEEQSLVMATNVLQSLRKEGRIRKSEGSTRSARYVRERGYIRVTFLLIYLANASAPHDNRWNHLQPAQERTHRICRERHPRCRESGREGRPGLLHQPHGQPQGLPGLQRV